MKLSFNGTANRLFRTVDKPPFIYGTAWKKERTAALVTQALAAGFRAFDTAAQPRHYREDLVGEALRQAYKAGVVKREEVYIQTKFTPPGGQDQSSAPYDFSDPLHVQIEKSIDSSLRNFREHEDDDSADSYIDCLVLHSPLKSLDETIAAWKLFEAYVPHKIRSLGLSNIDLHVCSAVHFNPELRVRPVVVQNRFYPATRFNADLRRLCAEQEIVYQSFWTLTGNPQLLKSNPVVNLSNEAAVSKEVALYSLVMAMNVAVLNGTTNEKRMAEDVQDVVRVRNWTFVYAEKWKAIVTEFNGLIGGDS